VSARPRSPAGDDVATIDVADELDMRLLAHSSMMAGDPAFANLCRLLQAWSASAARRAIINLHYRFARFDQS
jgi:hypothetical protein